ncbi:2Fe-2S iron-sulfur cluster-binding protein [Pleurocapsa sp. FMAR1]|uniref:2Fe-2S iron-sulfur cluster-binding protein n=1 Tax=Pleurocapsa sp. FMAR1 TaxID=3040204 RepID=UPI0029C6BFEC|nr:2Fe-2S iron-sulfur cluster-binding protein [Pleurocapsa sp. FMAR1]
MRIKFKRRSFGQLMFFSTVFTVIGDWFKTATSQPTQPTPTLTTKGAEVAFKINGVEQTVNIEPRVTLLDVLRERVGLTGTKKGCNHGQCGACTVLVDGVRINSCLALAVQYQDAEITTIEGIANGDELSPIQAAFINNDGFQCGYCTSGQICSAVAMLDEVAAGEASIVTADISNLDAPIELTDAEIKERMSGNLCRCGAYPGIVASVREVYEQA